MKDETVLLDRARQTTQPADKQRTQQQSTGALTSAGDIQSAINMAQRVIDVEAQAVLALRERIDKQFVAACRLLLDCTGRVIVCGVGKSGHIANKIAATLASTGTPAFFVHPSEASHGDFGMITNEDVVIAISYSGESEELKLILPLLKRKGNRIISLTGKPASTLAQAATINLDVSVAAEACPLGLAPTSSTTATLVMGDSLAIAVLNQRGFSATDFALSHPGGALGKKLLLLVDDIMVSGKDIPTVTVDTPLKTALYEMSAGQLGFLIITDSADHLIGVFSDGDLRRALDKNIDINQTRIDQIMTTGGHSIKQTQLAVDALELMETHKIYALPVIDNNNRICGALNMHSLLRAGVV